MQSFKTVKNLQVDGDEFTSGILGLDWLPTAAAKASKSGYENGVPVYTQPAGELLDRMGGNQ
jgi:hypothetical protein